MTASTRPIAFIPFSSTRSQSSSAATAARHVSKNCIDSSSNWIAATAISSPLPDSQQIQQHTQTFDAILPDSLTILSMSLVTVLCIVAAVVWNTQVVPVSRTKLAISKARGPVKDYLDELRTTDTAASTTTDATTTSSSSKRKSMIMANNTMDNSLVSNVTLDQIQDNDSIRLVNETEKNDNNSQPSIRNRAFERWLFTDWLQPRRSSSPKPLAIPILPKAKWNSGDNPVVVTAAIMMVGIVLASVTERIVS